jgi:broad-specificity NMP kinase
MGIRNYLIEGLSGTGKTSVCDELQRRGYRAIHGDRELAYQGDPETGEPMDDVAHEHHIWHVDSVKALVANQDEAVTFFCGGSRNFAKFIHLFDGVFVLEIDLDELNRRLDERPDSEWGGGKPTQRELIARLHRTKQDIPKSGILIDATAPIAHVVDEIVRKANQIDSRAVRHLDATVESRGTIPRMSEMPPWE